jgi:hypothetical protein
MTIVAFGNSLAEISNDLSSHIIELLQQCIDSNTDMAGNGEIHIDIHVYFDMGLTKHGTVVGLNKH